MVFQFSKIIILSLEKEWRLAGLETASQNEMPSTIIGSAESYFGAYLFIQIGANVAQCVIVQEKETIDVPFGKS